MKEEKINFVEALSMMNKGATIHYFDEETGCELKYKINEYGDVMIAYDEDEEFTDGILPAIANIRDKVFSIMTDLDVEE